MSVGPYPDSSGEGDDARDVDVAAVRDMFTWDVRLVTREVMRCA
jgi:hypothetical protein